MGRILVSFSLAAYSPDMTGSAGQRGRVRLGSLPRNSWAIPLLLRPELHLIQCCLVGLSFSSYAINQPLFGEVILFLLRAKLLLIHRCLVRPDEALLFVEAILFGGYVW